VGVECVASGASASRWKGESMENSSCKTSAAGVVKAVHLSQAYSESEIEYVCGRGLAAGVGIE
jgi:hypothetical protein